MLIRPAVMQANFVDPNASAFTEVVIIRASKLEAVRGALNKLAARAEKLVAKALRSGASLEGYEPISLTVLGGPFVVKTIGEGGEEISYLAVRVRLSGRAPKLAGWQMLAALQHEETGMIIRALPGTPEGLLVSYRNAASFCVHCGVRRARKDTYIVRHQDGTIKQVGRTCLADFTRSKGAAEVARFAALLSKAKDMLETGDRGHDTSFHPLQDFLAMGVHLMAEHGWVSRAAARERGIDSTATRILIELSKSNPSRPTTAQHDRAREALEWIQAKLKMSDNLTDYEHNLSVALATGYVTPRSAGLIASLLPARDRAASPPIPGHFGQIGKRDTWMLHLVKVVSFHGAYGPTYIHTFRDAAGHMAIWKTGKAASNPGHYLVTAAVKEHAVYQGQDQTVLTRATLEAREEPSPIPAP